MLHLWATYFRNFKDGQYDDVGKLQILEKCFNMFGRPILIRKTQKEAETHDVIVNKEVDDSLNRNTFSRLLGVFERMVVIEKFFTLLLNYLNLTTSKNSEQLRNSMGSSPLRKLATIAANKENIVLSDAELATLYSWIRTKANLINMPENCLELLLALGEIRNEITVIKKGNEQEMDLAREQILRKNM